MKIRILADNTTFIDQYYLGEPALSLYIEEGERKILFDTGYSDVLIRNAEKMGIDLRKITDVVLSHGHNDHTGGLVYLRDYVSHARLIAHPSCFEEKEDQGLPVGSPLSLEEVREMFEEVLLTEHPYAVTPSLTFLGEIPRIHSFEGKPVGRHKVNGRWVPDLCIDDSALSYESEEGIFVISGCAHSGIANILDYAKKLSGRKIRGVLGGFHLLKADEDARKTVEYLKKEGIAELYPCHCVSNTCRYLMFKEKLPVQDAGVGMEIEV